MHSIFPKKFCEENFFSTRSAYADKKKNAPAHNEHFFGPGIFDKKTYAIVSFLLENTFTLSINIPW